MYIFPFDYVNPGSRIIIYGAGDVGFDYCVQLRDSRYCEVQFLVDKNHIDSAKIARFSGIVDLFNPDAIVDADYDHIVVAAKSSKMREEIIGKLAELNVPASKIVVYRDEPPHEPLRDVWHKDIIHIETTMRCNMNCLFCSYGVQTRECSTLRTSAVKKILDELKLLPKEKQPTISYEILGEPLLNKDIFEIVEYTKSCGLTAAFITNGLLLNRGMAVKVNDSGLDIIYVSLHTLTEDRERIKLLRGVDFEFTAYLSNIMEFIFELGRLKSGCRVIVYIQGHDDIGERLGLDKYYSWRWYDDNADLMDKLRSVFRKFSELGNRMRYEFPLNYADALGKIPSEHSRLLSQGRYVDSFERIPFGSWFGNSARNFFQGFMFYPNMLLTFKSFGLNTFNINYLRRTFCLAENQVLYVEEADRPFSCKAVTVSGGILSNGNVVLCCGDQFGESAVGNIYDEPLMEAWGRREYGKHIQNTHLSRMCRRCHGKIIILDEDGEMSTFGGDVAIAASDSIFVNGVGKYYFIVGKRREELRLTAINHNTTICEAMVTISFIKRSRIDTDGFTDYFRMRYAFIPGKSTINIELPFLKENFYKVELIPVLCAIDSFELKSIDV